MKAIDFHTHIYSDAVVDNRNNFFHDEGFRELYADPKSRLIGFKSLIASMDEYNVEKSVCVAFPWERISDCDRENDYILSSAEKVQGRIIPFGNVSEKEHNIKGKIRDLAKKGFYGIGELAFYTDGLTVEKENYLCKVFEGCAEDKIAVMLHINEPVGKKYPGKYHTDFETLSRLFARFKDLTIICAHWGGGFFAYELVKGIREICSNVYYDCAASPYVYDKRIYSAALSIVGEDRILFGSDYPLIKPCRYFNEMNGLTEEITHKIVYDNARKVIGSIEKKRQNFI